MIDTVQAVLLFVIVLLTILFVILGIQVFYILRDLRQTIRRTNNILEDAENVSDNVTNSLNSFTNMFGGASALGSIASIISLFKRKKE
ncbi:MAG: hypothetical protein Q7T54_01500 [Candidatus Levybacteria bacterium]|nr:hypothetical protein [Candidatus Levybacteria bacterium]